MTTNPTPLTAESVAKKIIHLVENCAFPLIEVPPVLGAYAAQQNAEMVAEVNLYKKGSDFYQKRWQALRKLVGGLANLPDAASKIVSLEAENERLNTHNAMLLEKMNEINNCCGTVSMSSHNQMREGIEGAVELSDEALATTEADAAAWRANENDAAYQRGYEEAEKLGNIEIERLKQHNKALIPLAAWAKKHGHSMFCDMRNVDVMKNCRCTCGWVDAHQNHGLTTDQHLALAEYSDSLPQPPKEAT